MLMSMGIEGLRLEGGYRAYREFILRDMERLLEGARGMILDRLGRELRDLRISITDRCDCV